MRKYRFIIGLALLSGLLSNCAVFAQGNGSILYNKIDAQSNISLWQINPDGSGDQLIPVAAAAAPVWSWDGQLVAVTGQAQPGDVSGNVFIYDTQAGAVQQLTNFQDIVESDRSTTFFPLYKAFSPDGQRIAVSVVAHAQTTEGHSDDPFLQIYGRDGTLQATVAIGSDSTSGRGIGIAWSPIEDVLVYPFQAQTVAQGTGNVIPWVTALYRTVPAQDVVQTGQYRQLTFPRAFQGFTSWSWEIDFQPAISPDGRRVAYIRSVISISNGFLQFATPSIRVINMDGTGDHQVVQFTQGSYVTHVNWSPDGSQLVFDLGRQASSNGTPESIPDFSSMMLYTMRADGSNPRPLQGTPAFAPSWNPAGTGLVPPPQP